MLRTQTGAERCAAGIELHVRFFDGVAIRPRYRSIFTHGIIEGAFKIGRALLGCLQAVVILPKLCPATNGSAQARTECVIETAERKVGHGIAPKPRHKCASI